MVMPGAGRLVKEKIDISDPVAIVEVLDLVSPPMPIMKDKERGGMEDPAIIDRDRFDLGER